MVKIVSTLAPKKVGNRNKKSKKI